MQCPVAPWIAESVCHQLEARQAAVTAPFIDVFADYLQSMQKARELEVRVGQLDKEAAELREENISLHRKLERLEELSVHASAAQVEELKASVSSLEKELGGLYRDKARLLEEHVAANVVAQAARSEADTTSVQLTQARAEVAALRQQLSSTSSSLEAERQARLAAANELQSSFATREAAVVEAEKLRADNASLLRRLVQLKETERERMDEISRMHDEMLEDRLRQRQESASEREAAELIRLRTASGGSGSGSGMPTSPALRGPSLRDTMHLPLHLASAQRPAEERVLPKAPYRSVPAHRGGCCGLAIQPRGHLAATCGTDRTVMLWDTNLMEGTAGPSSVLQGMTSTVNDVAFTCEGQQVLGAGADRSIQVWNVTSGQQRHTLTGHSSSVTCVVCSPLDVRLAVTCSEDRSFKLWDLSKGFSIRTIPCTKMPNALAMTRDGNAIVTGHLDGSICLWDVRQSRAGGTTPLLESRETTAAITSISATTCDSLLMVSAKDNLLRLWDFRAASTQRTLRAPQFTIGTIGSMGRGRCSLHMSPGGRFLPAGATDGTLFVWDLGGVPLPGKEPLTQLRHHKDAVVAADWTIDSATMITVDKAGVTAFWALH